MARFHITKKGEPAPCRAQPGNCPLADSEAHYESQEAARQAYEASMSAELFAPTSSKTTLHWRGASSVELDRLQAQLGNPGRGNGSGTVEDPINVGGNTLLAAKLLAEGKHIRLNKVHEVGTLIRHLQAVVEDARSRGETAPNYDLCRVSVPKTNLFCAESKGIPRASMPQFSGQPLPGSPAEQFYDAQRGEADLSAAFRAELVRRGVAIERKTVAAAFLKASQAELDGPKVAGMSKAMEQGLVPEASIFVTRDGYIIDGHHRWASKVAIDTHGGELGRQTMEVEMLDMEIGEALAFANAYTREMGIRPKGLGAAAEGVA